MFSGRQLMRYRMPRPELRWKQVKILHGPATVMKEFCSGYATAKDEAIAETTWEGEQSIDI